MNDEYITESCIGNVYIKGDVVYITEHVNLKYLKATFNLNLQTHIFY